MEANKRIMSMMPDQFNRFMTQGGKDKPCLQCGITFNVYDKVLSKVSHGRTKYYHLQCWEKLFH